MRIRTIRGVNLEGNRVDVGTELDLPRRLAAQLCVAGKAVALGPWPPKDPEFTHQRRKAAEPETAPAAPPAPETEAPADPAPPATARKTGGRKK